MQLQINLPGYEDLKIDLNGNGEIAGYHLQGSPQTVTLFEKLLGIYGRKISQWKMPDELPEGCTLEERRSHFLLAEVIARAKSQWKLPFAGEMVCNCRQVTSESIDHAVVAGAMDVADVSTWTSACTSCTSCREKVESIIRNRETMAKSFGTLSVIKNSIF
jgi:NAD(P)H-nitrite reductase large subunit